MSKQGFGVRKETFTTTVFSIAIQLTKTDRPRRIEQIDATYAPTFAGTDNFAVGRVSVVRSLFDTPSLQIAPGLTGDLLTRLGEVVFDAFLDKMQTHFDFAGRGLVLLPQEDYTVLLHNPITSAAYQDWSTSAFPSQDYVGVLGVFGSEGPGADIFPVTR